MVKCEGDSTYRVQEFLTELEELCIKYGVTIVAEGGGHVEITETLHGEPCLLAENGIYDSTDI